MIRTYLLKYSAATLIGVLAVGSCVYAVAYYKAHRTNVLLQIEHIVGAITFPVKLAQLAAEEPVTAIPVPVHGVRLREIADTWGDARSEGRTHEGTDIFADRGTPVYAAARGYVIRVGENNLGGTVVFTVGPAGVRYYYAHLSSVADGIQVGVPVTTDTVVGFVGNTGNAETTPPHLHFGIYTNGPQNPYPFLVDRS